MRLRLLTVALALFSATLAARADSISIVLDSASSGTYNYGLELPASTSIEFVPGDSITLTGLAGVTSASLGLSNDGDFTISNTSTSVTLAENPYYSGIGLSNYSQDTYVLTDLFSVFSTDLTLGTVDFAINGTPASTGTVEGPMTPSVVPEPSSFVLSGTGLLMLGGIVYTQKRRRGSANVGLSPA
jgi:hypothetical protein